MPFLFTSSDNDLEDAKDNQSEGKAGIQMDLDRLEDGPAGTSLNLVRVNVQFCTWEGGSPATMHAEMDWQGAILQNLGALVGQQTEYEPALCWGREDGQQQLGLYKKEQRK